MKKLLNFLVPLFLVILTFTVRLYRLDNPIADWHSWRQADTAAVARNFIKADFNLLYPQSDSFLALNEHGLANPNRLFINEFPLYNALVALIYQHKGIDPIYGRLVSNFFATLGGLFLYLLTKKLFDNKTALFAGTYYALNPYNIYYGRVFMPDPAFVSLSIISLYLCLVWVKRQTWLTALLWGAVFALALLIKPYAIFMALPMLYWLAINLKLKLFKQPQLYAFALLSLLPLALWRFHYANHPEGTFASTWLLNGGQIRFTGAFFRWLIYDRLNRLIFATGGFVLFVVGIFRSYLTKSSGLVAAWLASVVLYLVIFAKGNVTHDYYQLPIMPVGAILVSLGFWYLVGTGKTQLQKTINFALSGCLLLLSLAFGWYEARGFFNINRPDIVTAGQAVDALLPKDALVIAPYDGDPAFLYQTNRYGWPDGVDIEVKVAAGATHYVSVNHDDVANYLKDRCQSLVDKPEYLIIDLRNCL